MILETVIGALVPVGAEAIKQLFNKWTGGVKPATIEEQLKLDDSDIRRMQALAALDNPYGTPSQWVVDLRASSRYIGSLIVIVAGVSTLFLQVDDYTRALGLEAANIAFGFLFGSRIIAHLKK